MKETISNDYITNLSSIEYLPKYFLGIDTSEFGKSSHNVTDDTGQVINVVESPYFKLKEKALDESLDMEDRMQCIRYMSRIPYINTVEHCIEATKSIISCEKYDIYKRFHFFANNDKLFKMDDHIVFAIHAYFFTYSVENKHPLELILLSARYILSFYSYDSDERNEVLSYVLDIADDENETLYIRAECADILINCGEGIEVTFGLQIIEKLGGKDKSIYNNLQNVHNETINDSVRKIIRALHKEISLKDTTVTVETIQNTLEGPRVLQKNNCNDAKMKEQIRNFLFRIMTDPSKYETLNLCDILILVFCKICKLDETSKQTCIERLKEEIIDCENTCSTGFLTRIINVLTGFVEGEELTFRMSPKDELRSVIFARINAAISLLPESQRNNVLECLMTEDKSMFDGFMDIYSPEEELEKEYEGLLSKEQFKEIFDLTIKQYKGLI